MSKVKHARYSPSSLDNLSKCVRFKYYNPDEGKDDDAATEGTMLHDAYEHENVKGLDDEQKDAVQKIIDYTNSLLATEGGPDCWEVIKEAKWTLITRTYGHADTVLIHKTKPIVHVIDAKFVRRSDDHSFQVRTYGAAVYEERFMGKDVKVITHVVAPRIPLIDEQEYEGKALHEEVCKEIDELYMSIDDPFTPPTPCEDLCSKCARASKCPKVGKAVVSVAQGLGLPIPEHFAPDAIVSLRDRAIAQILAGAMKTWAEQVKKNNNEYAKNGNDVPGFTLRSRSNGFRASSDVTPAIVGILKAQGYTEEELLEACTFSVSKLAKARAASTAFTEAEAKEDLVKAIGDLLTESTSQFLAKSKRISDLEALKSVTSAPQLGE
jgi:CRISPR/Cas system-associated exonuclease Cas4 (RecB family)